jgi:hypothetical protein
MDVLSSLDNSTQIAVLTNTLKDEEGNSLPAHIKTLLDFMLNQSLSDILSRQRVCKYVTDDPNFLLNGGWPPLSSLHHRDGERTVSCQEKSCQFVAMAFNSFKNKITNMYTIDEDDADELVEYAWLQHCDEVRTALEQRPVQPTTRHGWLVACRDLCNILEIRGDDNGVWKRCKSQYDLFCKRITYAPVDPVAAASLPSAARKAMTTEEADAHCRAVSKFAVQCLDVLQEDVDYLIDMYDINLQPFKTMPHAQEGHQRKKLGVWFITAILAIMKHGDLNDEEKDDPNITGDLRPLRAGDPFKFRFANDRSEIGSGHWILTKESPDEVWYSIVDTATKNKTKSPPLKVPVHLRCPRFAKFLIEWREIMGDYQQTDEPWLLCNMSKKEEERTPLYKSEDSQAAMKFNSQTVRNYDKRVWESCGVDGPHDATRTASARRTRCGENRSNEMLHSKSQELNYQGRKRPRVESESDEQEAPPPGDDEASGWNQFRSPAPGGWDQVKR